jgi:hypothetical protein
VDRLDLTPFHEAEKWGYHFCGPGTYGRLLSGESVATSHGGSKLAPQ